MEDNGLDGLGALWDVAGDILKAGAAVAEGQIEAHQAGEVLAKQQATEHTALQDAQAKDAQAATAIAHAIVSSAMRSKTADSDRTFADKALSDAVAARAGLSADSEKARGQVAAAQLAGAKSRSAATPSDGYKKALVTGWEQVISGSRHDTAKSGESWLTKRALGPLPGYGVVALGGGALVGVGFLVKRFLGRS